MVVVVVVVVVVVGWAVVVSAPSQSGSLGQAGAATPLKLMLVVGYAPVYLKDFWIFNQLVLSNILESTY